MNFLSVARPAFVLIAVFTLIASANAEDGPERYGAFSSVSPRVKLVGDDSIELEEEFSFRDEKNRTWLVPKGYVSDGASIPRPFWSIIGAPLSGAYRYAAIVHDYFCDRRVHNWEEVHLVFYKGMRAQKVDPRKAWVMYKAVYFFGPRWKATVAIPDACKPGPNFSPGDCIINSSGTAVVEHPPITKESVGKLLAELRSEGFVEEAKEIEEKVKIK